MRLKLLVSILYVSALLGLSLPNSARAAETVTILGASHNFSAPQPVDLTHTGIEITYIVQPQSSTAICRPVSQTVNPSTVKLESTSDSRIHPLHTVSWSDAAQSSTFDSTSVNQYRFKLSTPQVGYELRPYTPYILSLNGGESGIRFSCKDGASSSTFHFLPQAGYSVSFTTGPDTVAPVITEHSLMASHNTAVLGWITSEAAKTQISYGTAPGYGTTKSKPSTTEKHLIELTNLQPGTTYHYRLESKDADGSGAGIKTGIFTTWAISPITVADITGHEASLRWTTTPATDSIIEYGTTPNLGQISGKHGQATNHDVRLVHLQSNQTYYARIQLANGDASSASEIFSFKTLDASAGVSTDTLTINPEFSSEFDLANFNFRDFPTEALTDPEGQASNGAVLAETDDVLSSIAGNFGLYVQQHQWVVWLWVPVLLLIFLIACLWFVHRYQRKSDTVKREIIRQKAGGKSPSTPPQINY